ncbi:hypothetical protein F2Q69_00061035 [Brassica cretica]|uniref:Uncharacterized protein n=1 Tax=Brassica cretica TaxID=69181 RepID=A0A8S9RMH1_BRACR|nr:hypothetical protein F2Q69_00061035 [Brassica cretica]
MEFLETFECIWSSKEVIKVIIGRAVHESDPTGATLPERRHELAVPYLSERPYQSDLVRKTENWAENPNFGILEFFEEAGNSGNIFHQVRIHLEFIKNNQIIRTASKSIGIDRGTKNSPERPKLDEWTEKLEVARSMRSGRGGNCLAWYVAREA